MDASGIRKFESAKRLQREAYRAWMVGLMCSAISGFYTLWRLKERERRVDRKEGEGVVEGNKIVRYAVLLSLRLMAMSYANDGGSGNEMQPMFSSSQIFVI